MRYTKTTLLQCVNNEYKRLLQKVDSNTSKKLQALKIAKQIINSIDNDNKIFEIERAKNLDMFNIGSMIETVIKSHINKSLILKKSCATTYDVTYNGKKYEIKASISGTSKNTPYLNEKNVILVNALGVWQLDRELANKIVDKFGRFSPKDNNGIYIQELSELLGFNS